MCLCVCVKVCVCVCMCVYVCVCVCMFVSINLRGSVELRGSVDFFLARNICTNIVSHPILVRTNRHLSRYPVCPYY